MEDYDITNRNELAADTINGVYVCENAAAKGADVLFDMDFFEALGDVFNGVIYGNVTDEIAARIENEYGIR